MILVNEKDLGVSRCKLKGPTSSDCSDAILDQFSGKNSQKNIRLHEASPLTRHIKFWHLSEQPYEHSHWLFGAYHSAFENLSWIFVLAGFDGLWIRIYSPEEFKVVYARPVNWLMKVDLRNTQKKLRLLYTCIRTQWLKRLFSLVSASWFRSVFQYHTNFKTVF